jgi:N12 class adenine-specific DNA methylase
MPSKVQFYSQMADHTAKQITGSFQSWTAFLETAARLYKYPYNEQLMIFAQRPNATACADYDLWNTQMRRYVRRGSKGIALLDTSGDNPKIKYVFDVADTGGDERSRRPFLWEYRDEHADAVSAALERRFEVSSSEGLADQLEHIASRLASEYWEDHQRDICGILADSFLEEYDIYNVGVAFKNAASVSVAYTLMSRCGLSPEDYFDHEDFLNVFDFNTPATIAALGTSISEASEQVLRTIEVTIKNYERERSVTNERTDVQDHRRSADSRTEPVRADDGASRKVREDAEEILAGASPDPVESDDPVRDPVPAPAGDRRGSVQTVGNVDAGTDAGGRRDGGIESQRPDDVGGADEQLQDSGGRNNIQRPDLQLNFFDAPAPAEQLTLFPTEAEQMQRITEAESVPDTPFAFSFAQDDIDQMLRSGSNTDNSRMNIVAEYAKGRSTDELAAFLQTQYHGGFGLHTDHGDISAWYAEDGIHFARGNTARYTQSAQIVPWEDAAKRIGEMLDGGSFATNVELAEAESHERQQIAESLWYLYHDMSEDAHEVGYLGCIDELRGGGFPDETARLAEQIADPVFRERLTSQVNAFLIAYGDDRSLMRFNYHRPDQMLHKLLDLNLPRTEYHTELAELPTVYPFITEDEINEAISGGSGMEGGKFRIFEYFSQTHTTKERADFLKEEYGIGGHSHALSRSSHSGEDHDSKGDRFKKADCADVMLSWTNMANRIDDLISKNRYLTPLEQEKYKAIHDAPTAYNSAKEAHPDDIVLYQVGDFFEMYGEDAKTAAEELDLYLTSRRIPDVGRVDMCGIPARKLEEYVDKLRDRHDVTISAVNEDTHERHAYTMLSIDHEAERATDAYEAEHGADGYLAFPGNRPEEEPKRELTQDDIDESLLRWNGDPDSQQRMYDYMREHGRERGAAAWLSQEYGGDVNEPLHISLAGADSEVTLKWTQVQRRLLQIMNDGRFPEQQKNIAEYLGERGNTLYFYAPVSFGIETDFGDVPKLRDDQRVVIASPVCYHGDEFLQEHRVTFLKVGRDIEEAQLKGQTPTEQIAAMEQAENAFYTPEDRAYHVGDHVSIGNKADGKSEIVIENVDADYVYYTFPDVEQEPVEILRSQFDAHLDDRLFAIIQPEEPAADLSPERMEQLVEAFEAAGYTYDDINSYGGYLVFHGEGGDGCAFQSWEEADEWINGVVFDEPERNEAVERVLHPDRYAAPASEQGTNAPGSEANPEPVTPIPQTAEVPYKVGDTVYLDNKPFEITSIGDFDVELRDPTLYYPIFRAESRENLERLLHQDERNVHFFAEPEQTAYTTETVAFYPAEENHLPYDIEIQTLHIPEKEPPAPITPPPENFRITDEHLGEGGAKAKFRMNMDAINLLKELEFDGRQATPEEQEVLSKYVGWGGLADAFDRSKENWLDEFIELASTLSPEEYAAARASTLNAHFTSPTVISAIYDAVGKMGFTSGNILEPSMGVGNFFGMLPSEMSGSKLYGVELDSITGRIAKQLYPNADITVAGFETTNRRDFYDLAVGNVPFGQYQVNDPQYNKFGFSIHNYFFAKALDQVRPGGVVAFVTSRYTMDAKDSSARKYLAERADFLGAIRLPNNAFKANAGTDVVSDIIFLQKRDHPVTVEPDWVHLGQNEDGFAINSYFVDHPEMILGRQTSESTQYGKQDFTVEPIEGLELKDQLADAVKYIRGTYKEAELPDLGEEESIRETIPADPNVKNYSYTIVDGDVYFRENSVMVKPDLNATAQERVKGLVALRNCVHELIDLQMDEYIPDSAIREKQTELNGLYDSFTAKYGLINDRANKLAFSDDSSYYLLCSLEILDDERNFKAKADIFSKRTIKPQRSIDHVDTPVEALAVSIGEKACVDLPYMAQLCGKTTDEVTTELRGIIFKDPAMGADPLKGWQTADEYLSGNVRSKLRIAQRAADRDPSFQINVEALEKAQPKDLDASEIEVRLGATWIDKQYIQQFMEETFNPPYYLRRNIQVNYSPYTAEWQITGKSMCSYNDVNAYVTYGTDRANAYRLLEDALNLRDIRIYDTVEDADGKERRVLNAKETTLAAQKQQAIRDAFKDWIWRDPDRRQTLVTQYNEEMNSTRPREYDGSHIVFSGMNPEITLREHQRNAIAHVMYGGNTLLAHEVGAGKTFEMVAAAMESKRLGLCNKSIFVVPNHLTEQWASEFLRLYPSANILVTTKKDFETHNRQKFCSRIATGDYDAVIIGHSQFEKIPISAERQERLLQEQIDDITAGIDELKYSSGEHFTVKQLERTKKSLEVRLEKLQANERKDDVITFEQLGVDRMFVDESDNYKNLFLYTKMRNVAGLSTTDAQKSSDMFLKCRYMDEITGNRGVVFATGTPVSNSMTELYTIQRYLQYDRLQASGMGHFDCWASRFGETTTALELAPEGTGYRARTRFAKFFNLPELMNMFKEVADIKTADELHLPTPEVEYHTYASKPTEIQKEMVKALSERATKVHAGVVDPSVDNMLKITSDGRKLGLDQRIINPMLPDEQGTKVNQCVDNILQYWRDGEADKLTQLVFCDISTPKGRTAPTKAAAKASAGVLDSPEIQALQDAIPVEENTDAAFTIYDDIRQKLIDGGMPPEQIAFIHDADTDVRKKELFGKVRSGQVRVLLGSTAKMGAGTNVQDRLIALHDLDCPWRPRDLTQRKGRIERQGNQNEKVHVCRYVTEGTFDAYLWQTVENKQKFISQIMTSKTPLRSCDDVDETALSFAEIKALCAGDPRIKERMDLDVDVSKLKIMKADHQSKQYRMEDNLMKYYPEKIEQSKGFIKGFEADMKTLAAHPHPTDGFAGMEIRGDKLTDKENAGAALLDACKEVKNSEPLLIGHYRGFAMSVHYDVFEQKHILTLKGEMSHRAELGADARGNLIRIDNALDKMPDRLEAVKGQLENLYQQQELAKAEVGKPFPFEQELATKTARLIELDMALNLDGRTQAQPEQALAKGKPSVLEKLKATMPIYGVSDKKKIHEMEVR